MLSVFDKYMIRNIATASVFVALTLSVIIFLTQSLRFLELVIEAGASSSAFWQLTFLALPRFFEVILPLAVLAGVVFTYSRMVSDSEIVVLRSSGVSASSLVRPAIIFALIVTAVLLLITLWAGPKSLAKMQDMRQVIKSQFSTAFLKEGVFNQVGKGLTVYIHQKDKDGELRGLMINDSRDSSKPSSMVIAKRGVLVSKDNGFEVLVHEGSRQEYDAKKAVLSKLDFERYTIDLPSSDKVHMRSADPDEMTVFELFDPKIKASIAEKDRQEFSLEIHKRFISPFLAMAYALIGCACLLLGSYNRRGQARRITLAVVSAAILQGLYLSAFNLAGESHLGLILMYALVLVPITFCAFMLSPISEGLRRHLLYGVGVRA